MGKILVVEDDPVGQAVISGMLANLKYSADIASNGNEAVERITETPYQLVFMDCLMPEMDGLQTTRAIRQMEKENRIELRTTIVALTAKAMKGDKEECLAAVHPFDILLNQFFLLFFRNCHIFTSFQSKSLCLTELPGKDSPFTHYAKIVFGSCLT